MQIRALEIYSRLCGHQIYTECGVGGTIINDRRV
jgi:hypothetical protein